MDDILQPNAFPVNSRGHRVNSDPDSRDAASYSESTRDPIFLLQKRIISGIDTIDGLDQSEFYHDGEDLWISVDHFEDAEVEKAKADDEWRKGDEDFRDDSIRVDNEMMVERGWAIFHWQTESVFFRRPEAEDYAKSQRHNLGELGKGCRVYCVCAEGRLAAILKIVDCKEVEEYLNSMSFKMDYAAYKKMGQTMIGG